MTNQAHWIFEKKKRGREGGDGIRAEVEVPREGEGHTPHHMEQPEETEGKKEHTGQSQPGNTRQGLVPKGSR